MSTSPQTPRPSDETPIGVGEVVGRWRIVRLIGAGGTACVYEAEHTEMPRRVALKVLYHRYAYSHEMRSRFLREGRAAASVHHAGVVAVHDVGVESDRLFLVMDLVEGESLRDRVRRHGPLGATELVRLFTAAADALDAVHTAGILHRDLSPSNLMIAADERGIDSVTLLDFSAARLDEPSREEALTRSNAILGTPAYMSPEHCRGARDLDVRSDVFSLGAVMHFAATGRPPFDGPSWQTIMVNVLAGKRAQASRLAPALPRALDEVIDRAMAHDPSRRFATAAELRHALVDADLTASTPFRRWIGAALVVIGASAMVAVTGGGDAREPPRATGSTQPAPIASVVAPDPMVAPARAAPSSDAVSPVAVEASAAPTEPSHRARARPRVARAAPRRDRAATLPAASALIDGAPTRGANNALILMHGEP